MGLTDPAQGSERIISRLVEKSVNRKGDGLYRASVLNREVGDARDI